MVAIGETLGLTESYCATQLPISFSQTHRLAGMTWIFSADFFSAHLDWLKPWEKE